MKGSGVTSKADWLLKVVLEKKDFHCIWLNMFGDIIIEMIVYNYRKNSFLNTLKGATVSGSFKTLP